jgi:hypothetical protein
MQPNAADAGSMSKHRAGPQASALQGGVYNINTERLQQQQPGALRTFFLPTCCSQKTRNDFRYSARHPRGWRLQPRKSAPLIAFSTAAHMSVQVRVKYLRRGSHHAGTGRRLACGALPSPSHHVAAEAISATNSCSARLNTMQPGIHCLTTLPAPVCASGDLLHESI